jgi:xanthine dehydrogenase accessory factor
MAEWTAALGAAQTPDQPAVLVTVAHTTGSAPREAGTAMVVTANGIAGSIGGGHLEFDAIRIARDALAAGSSPKPWLVRFPLAARLGQCCGGVATLAFTLTEPGAWRDAVREHVRTAVPFALVTSMDATGPAECPLVVTTGQVVGTLGAPGLDASAAALARERLAAPTAGAWLTVAPGADQATLLIHVAAPHDFHILVFGNGHVGRALVQVLGTLAADVLWIDSRDADFPAAVPGNVRIVATDDPEEVIDDAPRGAWVVILTHSHALDYALLERALTRDDWRYLGLIGSRSKRNQFMKRLAARGATPTQLARVVCPIGTTSGIRDKAPGAIAIAVAAEMLELRERSAGAGTDNASAEFAGSRSTCRDVPTGTGARGASGTAA